MLTDGQKDGRTFRTDGQMDGRRARHNKTRVRRAYKNGKITGAPRNFKPVKNTKGFKRTFR